MNGDFPGFCNGIILRCLMTPVNLAKKPVAEMEDSTVVGKILEKWGEFRPLPCWHRSGKKVTSSDFFRGVAGSAQFFSVFAWLSFPAEEVTLQMLVKVWLGCGCFVEAWVAWVWRLTNYVGQKNLGIPIPFTAKIAGSRWSSRQNMVSIGDQSPCYMRCTWCWSAFIP